MTPKPQEFDMSSEGGGRVDTPQKGDHNRAPKPQEEGVAEFMLLDIEAVDGAMRIARKHLFEARQLLANQTEARRRIEEQERQEKKKEKEVKEKEKEEKDRN